MYYYKCCNLLQTDMVYFIDRNNNAYAFLIIDSGRIIQLNIN